jgi:hypothetical protein
MIGSPSMSWTVPWIEAVGIGCWASAGRPAVVSNSSAMTAVTAKRTLRPGVIGEVRVLAIDPVLVPLSCALWCGKRSLAALAGRPADAIVKET